jgi:dimethylglycine dehydrogenase
VVNGPIPYTPDGLPLIGPAYGLDDFYLCCAFSFGIAQGPGAGQVMAEILVDGEPEWDMWALDPRRFTDYANIAYTTAKAVELYQREYDIIFPCDERPAGRPAKTTPLYDRLKAKGAQFGARGGWERATWFAPEDAAAENLPSFHHANWFEAVGEECRAVREGVGVLDLGGFSKFEVAGPGAAAFLDRLIAGRLPGVGRISLSYFCSPKGGIVSEVTITRTAEDCFLLCAAAAAETHDHQWMAQRLTRDDEVTIANVTARSGTLILAGPRARDVLSQVTSADLSNQAFPWLSAREIETLRLEKCYRAWKVDMTHEYTPLDAGLDRFVQLDKPDFVGRAALLKQRQEGVPERFVPLLVEDGDAEAPFCASVLQGDEVVGLVTSGGYGYSLKKSIALAYVRQDLAETGRELEIDIYGTRRKAVVAEEPLYDPKNERLRA